MPSPTIPDTTTLQAIQTKVRRLTRSLSENLLTTDELNNYINTFVVYDFPEHLRTFNLRRPFTFICNPYQDTYATNTTLAETNPLYNFQNKYISVHPPVYIGGYQRLFTQSRTELFSIYPMVNSRIQLSITGDGVTTSFAGTINFQQSATVGVSNNNLTLLQYNVLFSSIADTGQGLSLIDVPAQDTATGNLYVLGGLYIPGTEPSVPPAVIDVPGDNFVNYITGEFIITFPVAPGAGQQIFAQVVPTAPAIPQAMLYYNNVFTLRPVPDQPYRINFEVYARPDALLDEGQSPELEEWWQLIAYGAAKKVFEDRQDIESVQMIMPEYKQQLLLCNRRTIVQNTNERVATIYTQTNKRGYGWGNGWGNGFGNF